VTGPWHYREATLLLMDDSGGCAYGCPHSGCAHEIASMARAQVHATLALVAAFVDGRSVLTPADRHEWLKATDPEYAAGQAAEVTR
jgi:hypothetical protein